MLEQQFLELSKLGAEWVLWVLIALSVLSFGVVVDRLILYISTKEKIDQFEPGLSTALNSSDMDKAIAALDGDGLIKNVLRSGIEAMKKGYTHAGQVEQAMLGKLVSEKDRYESRLTIIGTIGNNAPFVGLFGTVIGIIQAFYELGRMEMTQQSGNQLLMAAISEALIATGVGILVAIPAVAAFNACKSHVNGKCKKAESMMRAILSGIKQESAKGS